MLRARRLTLSLLVPFTLVIGLVAPTTAGAAPSPQVVTGSSAAILDPVDGATVGGQDVIVDATGGVGSLAAGGEPQSLTLLVDGSEMDTEDCETEPTATSCDTELDWDTTAAALGAHQLTVELTTSLGTSAPSPVVHVTLADLPVPVVTISSPTAGATVGGYVAVTATGSVDSSLGDFPLFMGLLVDGTLVGDVVSCPAAGACTLSFSWDATTLSGTHQLQVGIATEQNGTVSAPITVTVLNPPPVAVITTPAAGASVSGFTTVTARGTVDATGGDRPQSLEFFVDGVSQGADGCGATPICSASILWSTAGLVGAHNLQVKFTTKRTSVLSPVTTVDVAPVPTQLQLDGPTLLRRGAAGSVTGVLYLKSGSVAGSAPVHVTFTPAGGQPMTVSVTTANGSGRFVAQDPLPVLVNTTVQVLAGPAYGASSAAETLWVSTPIGCVLPTKLKHGVSATVTCKAPLLPNGVVVRLHDIDKGSHILATAKAKGGKVRFTFKLPHKRQFAIELWAATASSSRYGATNSPYYRIRAL
jgi:hypothetical protein